MKNRKWTYHLLTVCATELTLFLLGMRVIGRSIDAVIPQLAGIQDAMLYEFAYWAAYCTLFLLSTAAILLYMRVTDRAVLSRLAPGRGTGRALAIGSLVGIGLNLLCVLLAAATGCFTLTFSGFKPLVLPMLLFCFFTCSCEELFCRGYVLEYLKKRYPIEVAAFAGGVLFIFHHIDNMQYYGFNAFFALNAFLICMLLVLITEMTGSIWAAFGVHTLWNFNQQFVMGLPNSGVSSTLSIFRAENAVSGMFFDPQFGLEGAPGTTLVYLLAIAALLMLLRRRRASAQG